MATTRENIYGFSVYPESRSVTQTRLVDGVYVTETVPASQVFKGYEPSLFDAWHKRDDIWGIDLDCGAQRWRGEKTTRQVRAALRKCGFDKKTIDRLMKKYKQGDKRL